MKSKYILSIATILICGVIGLGCKKKDNETVPTSPDSKSECKAQLKITNSHTNGCPIDAKVVSTGERKWIIPGNAAFFSGLCQGNQTIKFYETTNQDGIKICSVSESTCTFWSNGWQIYYSNNFGSIAIWIDTNCP